MRNSIPFPLLLDPRRRLQTGLGLHRQSLPRYLFDLRAWLRWLRAFVRHRRPSMITDHYADVPADAIVVPGGEVTYLHRGRAIGDYPPLSEAIAALRAAIGTTR